MLKRDKNYSQGCIFNKFPIPENDHGEKLVEAKIIGGNEISTNLALFDYVELAAMSSVPHHVIMLVEEVFFHRVR